MLQQFTLALQSLLELTVNTIIIQNEESDMIFLERMSHSEGVWSIYTYSIINGSQHRTCPTSPHWYTRFQFKS